MGNPSAIIRLPTPHKFQEQLCYWDTLNPNAQCLVAPCGTKSGKSFGSAFWLAKEAILTRNLYCVWIAPTYKKARIGYRYIKAMLNIDDVAKPVDGKLEIRLANGSQIIFLHGYDAEVTVEGEAIDRFVLDEAAKLDKQVWFSLFTTITQTGGYGIVTGTPRGFNWYHDIYNQSLDGDTFFADMTLRTIDSPFVKQTAVDRAKRILPLTLYEQYYLARFVSAGEVFGDLTSIWTTKEHLPKNVKYWVHPNASERSEEIFHGVDVAKKKDYTVFYSVNQKGETVGYCRFNKISYPRQAERFKHYINKFFKNSENIVDMDVTGVGEALKDQFNELDMDIVINPIHYTNQRKQDMVTKTSLAIENNWLKAPRIRQLEKEMAAFEVAVTKTGLHTYNAPSGEHDDVVNAMMMAVNRAYDSVKSENTSSLLGYDDDGDNDIIEFINSAVTQNDDYFDSDESEENDDDIFTGTDG